LEAIHAPVELRVREHRLDHALTLAVERGATVGLKDTTHERVETALPARPGALALAGVGRDQHLDAARHDVVDLHLMPVAGIGDDDLRRLGAPDRSQLLFGRGDHRLEMPEVW